MTLKAYHGFKSTMAVWKLLTKACWHMNWNEVPLESQNPASNSENSFIYSVLRYSLHAKEVPKSHKYLLKSA